MAKEKISFESFLETVGSDDLSYVKALHEYLASQNCTVKIESAKSGYVLSYISPESKKVLANYVFRKKGMIMRIYGDHASQYQTYIQKLPDSMHKEIEKSAICKRLHDPAKCNPRCKMGYQFTLNDIEHKKCRYGAFMFLLNETSWPYIKPFLEHELKERELFQLMQPET